MATVAPPLHIMNSTGVVKLRGTATAAAHREFHCDGIAACFGGSKPDKISEYYRDGGLVENNLFYNSKIAMSGTQKFSNYRGARNTGVLGTDPTVPDGVDYEVLRVDVSETQIDGVTAHGAARGGLGATFGTITTLNKPSDKSFWPIVAIYALGPAVTGVQSSGQHDMTWNFVIVKPPTSFTTEPTKFEISHDGTHWIDITSDIKGHNMFSRPDGMRVLVGYHSYFGPVRVGGTSTPNPAYDPTSILPGTQQVLVQHPDDPDWVKGSWMGPYIRRDHFYIRISA